MTRLQGAAPQLAGSEPGAGNSRVHPRESNSTPSGRQPAPHLPAVSCFSGPRTLRLSVRPPSSPTQPLTRTLLKASGGVDDDIQEPVEPGRFIICARDQRGERPSSWEKQAGDRFCFKVTLVGAPRDCHLLSRGQGNVRSRNTPIVASVSGTLGSSWVHNMGKPGTEKRRDRFSGQERVGEHATWMGCVCLSVQSIPLCVAACARVCVTVNARCSTTTGGGGRGDGERGPEHRGSEERLGTWGQVIGLLNHPVAAAAWERPPLTRPVHIPERPTGPQQHTQP